jgi:hypothetical protein
MKWKPVILCLTLANSLSGQILFRGDFETGDFSQWERTGTRGQHVKPGNVDLVTDIARRGKYAVRMTIHPQDVFNDRQLRVQLGGPRITVEEGAETFLRFSLFVANAPKDRDNFFYWEGAPPPRYNNVMTWWLEPSPDGATKIRYGTGNLGRNGVEWESDFSVGEWHDLVMAIRWSEDPQQGRVRLWFDRKPVLDKPLRTKGPEQVYFCQPGIHRSPHSPAVDSIYLDEFILGATLKDVLPD